MGINIKRFLFSILLICATLVSFVFHSQKGFNISISIIFIPFSLLYLLKLSFPEFKVFSEISYQYNELSSVEKLSCLVNSLLICIWLVAQIYSLI